MQIRTSVPIFPMGERGQYRRCTNNNNIEVAVAANKRPLTSPFSCKSLHRRLGNLKHVLEGSTRCLLPKSALAKEFYGKRCHVKSFLHPDYLLFIF